MLITLENKNLARLGTEAITDFYKTIAIDEQMAIAKQLGFKHCFLYSSGIILRILIPSINEGI